MNWQQHQLQANQRRIREFQAQQNLINSHGGHYISPGVGPAGYAHPTMYHPSQQSYVYPPTTQWIVMDQTHSQPASHYAPGYGQQYYPPHYYQRQMPNTGPPPPPPPPSAMSRSIPPQAPWHSSQTMNTASITKPSGKGLTYAELLSKALPTTSVRQQQQQPANERSTNQNPPLSSISASPVPKPQVIELPKPPPPPSAKTDSEAYPPSLLKYVERAFLQCKSDIEKSEIQKLLKLRIQTAKQNGVLWTQDWDNMALPHVPSPLGAKRKSESKLSKKQQKKLKKQQALMAAAASAITSASMKGTIADSKKMTMPVNEAALKLRNARFGTSFLNDASSSISSRPLTLFHNRLRNESADGDIELDWEALKICGTCNHLEKKYLRLTSAPDPSSVRPLHILRKSFDHILRKWSEDRNYLFFWEQMKSLRQDLTIQHIIDPFVIQVYETNARVCLEVDDLSEYNQCQTQLSELYDNHSIEETSKSNMDEFVGYRLLYLLLTNDPMSISSLLRDTASQQRQHDLLSHAISTLRAFRTNDFCRFFELSSSSPLQSAQIIRHLHPTVRYNALLRITAAFRPTLPVSAISNMLGFADLDSCRTWLLASGAVLDQSRDNIICKESSIVRAQLSVDDSQEIIGVTHGTF